jgi:hypothetical protein
MEKNKVNSTDINKIMMSNNITIPAWVLYTLIQYTELSLKRESKILVHELIPVGSAYEQGSSSLLSLINHETKKEQKLETIKEESDKEDEQIDRTTQKLKIKRKKRF